MKDRLTFFAQCAMSMALLFAIYVVGSRGGARRLRRAIMIHVGMIVLCIGQRASFGEPDPGCGRALRLDRARSARRARCKVRLIKMVRDKAFNRAERTAEDYLGKSRSTYRQI